MAQAGIDGAGSRDFLSIPNLTAPSSADEARSSEAAGAQGISTVEQAENSEKALAAIVISAFPELVQPDFYANSPSPFLKLTATLQKDAERVNQVVLGTLDAWLESIWKEAELSKASSVEKAELREGIVGNQVMQERYEMEMAGVIHAAQIYLFTATGFQMLADPLAFIDEEDRDISKARNYVKLAVHVLSNGEFHENLRAFARRKAGAGLDEASREELADRWAAIAVAQIAYTGIALMMRSDAPEIAGGGQINQVLESSSDETLRRLGAHYTEALERLRALGMSAEELQALHQSVDGEVEGVPQGGLAIFNLPSSVFSMVETAALAQVRQGDQRG